MGGQPTARGPRLARGRLWAGPSGKIDILLVFMKFSFNWVDLILEVVEQAKGK